MNTPLTRNFAARNGQAKLAELLDCEPANNLEAEEDVLTAVLLKPALFAELTDLPDEAFYDTNNRMVWSAMRTVAAMGDPPEVAFILPVLKSRPSRVVDGSQYDELGGKGWFTDLLCGHATPEYHLAKAAAVRDCWAKRNIVNACLAAIQEVHRPNSKAEHIADAISASSRELAGQPRQTIRVYNAAEIASAECDYQFYCDDTLVAGIPAGMIAASKAGKTTTGLSLMVCLSAAIPFLDRYAVPQQLRTLTTLGEGGLPHAKSIMVRYCAEAGISLAELKDNLFLAEWVPNVKDAASLAELETLLRIYQPHVLNVDPWYMAAGDLAKDAANLFSSGSVMRDLQRLCAAHNCTPLITHHTTKSSSGIFERPPTLGDAQFAGMEQFLGQWFLLGRRSPYDDQHPGHHELWLSCAGRWGDGWGWALDVDEGSRHDPEGRHLSTVVRSVAECRNEVALVKKKDKNAAALAEAKVVADTVKKAIDKAGTAGIHVKGLIISTPYGKTKVERVLQTLNDEGLITSTEEKLPRCRNLVTIYRRNDRK